MPSNTLLLVYGAVFIGALLFLEGLFYLIVDVRGRSSAAANRRLRLHAAGVTGEAALLRLRRGRRGNEGALAVATRSIPGYEALDRLLARAGLQISVGREIAIFFGLCLGLFLVFSIFGRVSQTSAAVLATGFGIGLPLLILHRIARHRINKIRAQLPDAIEMIVRSLHAGHPISAALGLVAQEARDPIGTEFGITYDEMTYGLDLGDALGNLSDRVALREVHFMVVAVRLQHSTGGNLAETLSILARVVRERQRMRDKIKALSAEGRMSAVVLSVLPVVVGGGLYLMNPKYYAGIPSDVPLTVGMGTALFLLLFGIFVMFRVVNFRV
jgi:tight adherence protein B